ncbi:MAG: cupin domain-containing protein [Opitutaceae bacterium]|nr:cupin domain-containing protein [Verrucomicrobiales bacterium]
MNLTELMGLAAGNALGALAPADAARLQADLARNPEARADVAAFLDTAALIATTGIDRVSPPPGLRARILEQAARTPQTAQPGVSPVVADSFRFVRNDETGWIATPISGLKVKALSVSRDMGYQVLLAHLAPGARFPEHDHQGSEELFVVSGHLHTEGRVLGPGDFLHAEPGTHHHELFSPDGCVALLVERVPLLA